MFLGSLLEPYSSLILFEYTNREISLSLSKLLKHFIILGSAPPARVQLSSTRPFHCPYLLSFEALTSTTTCLTRVHPSGYALRGFRKVILVTLSQFPSLKKTFVCNHGDSATGITLAHRFENEPPS